MSQDELEPRVSALEAEVRGINRRLTSAEQDAAAARVLAGAADRDVTEMQAEIRDFRRATAASFTAMRQDFVDLRQDFVDLRQDFVDLRDRVGAGFDKVDQGFLEMRGKLDGAAAGQQRIVQLIEGLAGKRDL